MAALEENPRHTSTTPVVTMVLAAIIGVPIGLYGSIFGPYYSVAVGAFLVIVGAIGTVRGARWNRILLIFGAAVIVGAASYFMIGVLTPDGAGSGFGNDCAASGSCE
ncbi:hypothetical protein [Microbacterium sp. A94]|uniref:hypothetical protein n=1 Tax=Microbacterium sp. A94 TaxID=3450717 RepID=UPI003F436B46